MDSAVSFRCVARDFFAQVYDWDRVLFNSYSMSLVGEVMQWLRSDVCKHLMHICYWLNRVYNLGLYNQRRSKRITIEQDLILQFFDVFACRMLHSIKIAARFNKSAMEVDRVFFRRL